MQLICSSSYFCHNFQNMKPIVFSNSIIPWMGKTAKFMGYYLSDGFKENGIDLSKEQFLVLMILKKKQGCNQNELAFVTNRSKTSLTRMFKTLEKKGLAYRCVSDVDKRINHVHLTELGHDVLEKAIPVVKELINEVQTGISESDLITSIKVMEQILTNINNRTTYNKS